MSDEIPREYAEVLERVRILEEKLERVMNGQEVFEAEKVDTSMVIEPRPKVRVKPHAFFKLLDHAFSFANDTIPQENWVEVIGILTGKVENPGTPIEQIVVYDYWPVGSGDGVSVNILDAEPMVKIYQEKKVDEFIVGWAHSHPSYSPFMSSDDIATHIRYQSLWEDSIAIVIDPVMISPSYYGFSVFQLTDDFTHYFELECEIEGLSPRAAYDAFQVFLKKKLRKEHGEA